MLCSSALEEVPADKNGVQSEDLPSLYHTPSALVARQPILDSELNVVAYELLYRRAEGETPARPLLLAGTGTGLAPLFGVLRTALQAGHGAPMRLLHGAANRAGLYLWSTLASLAASHRQLQIAGSAPDDDSDARITERSLQQQVLECGLPLSESRIYLCGNPGFVRSLRKQLYLAGTPLSRIHADPFLAPAVTPDKP